MLLLNRIKFTCIMSTIVILLNFIRYVLLKRCQFGLKWQNNFWYLFYYSLWFYSFFQTILVFLAITITNQLFYPYWITLCKKYYLVLKITLEFILVIILLICYTASKYSSKANTLSTSHLHSSPKYKGIIC
jgi:hypothetical protein